LEKIINLEERLGYVHKGRKRFETFHGKMATGLQEGYQAIQLLPTASLIAWPLNP
jgi:hypothetical protein